MPIGRFFLCVFAKKRRPGMRLSAFLGYFCLFFIMLVARLWTIATRGALRYNYYVIIIGIVGFVYSVKNDIKGIKMVLYNARGMMLQ